MQPSERARPRRVATIVAVGLVTAMAATACTGGDSQSGSVLPTRRPGVRIPQPQVDPQLGVAPESARIDTAMPTFSKPTNITNPLFPVSKQESVLMLGQVDGLPFRTEVTLLPETRIIEWQGLRVETAVSQYNAFLDGRIDEIAYDYYAQADDGSVWYFGEDVFDFRDGTIVVTEGTWLAGRDGPAAMIMPGQPKVGDVYRPENAPAFVFEEVTVGAVGKALDGPLGSVQGGMLANELHADGSTEQKIFAPGYGEFLTGGGGDLEALALAVPTDRASGAMPAELTTLSDGALSVFDAAASRAWSTASTAMKDVSAAWATYRAGEVPKRIEPVMSDALTELSRAVDARSAAATRNAAIQVARSSFDLQLRYRPVAEIDLARLDLWAAQLLVDAQAKDEAGVGSDHYAMDYVRDRIRGALSGIDLAKVNTELGAIQVAVKDQELSAAAEAAKRLRASLAQIQPVA